MRPDPELVRKRVRARTALLAVVRRVLGESGLPGHERVALLAEILEEVEAVEDPTPAPPPALGAEDGAQLESAPLTTRMRAWIAEHPSGTTTDALATHFFPDDRPGAGKRKVRDVLKALRTQKRVRIEGDRIVATGVADPEKPNLGLRTVILEALGRSPRPMSVSEMTVVLRATFPDVRPNDVSVAVYKMQPRRIVCVGRDGAGKKTYALPPANGVHAAPRGASMKN